MAVISQKFGYLYLATPNTGSTAVCDFLIESCDGNYIPEHIPESNDNWNKLDYKHCTIQQLLDRGELTNDSLAKLWKFTTVRNPLQYFVSEWFRYHRWKDKFEDPNYWISQNPLHVRRGKLALSQSCDKFVRDVVQSEYLSESPRPLYEPFADGVDSVIRNEDLPSALVVKLRGLGVECPDEIPKVNVTWDPKKNYREQLSQGTIDLVYRAFKSTFEAYGYSAN